MNSRAGPRMRISVVLLTLVEKVYIFFGIETVQNVEKTEKIKNTLKGLTGWPQKAYFCSTIKICREGL